MLDANAYEANIGRTFRITQLDMDMITLDVDMITLDGILQTLALDPVYATTKIYVGSMHSDTIYIYISLYSHIFRYTYVFAHCVHAYNVDINGIKFI